MMNERRIWLGAMSLCGLVAVGCGDDAPPETAEGSSGQTEDSGQTESGSEASEGSSGQTESGSEESGEPAVSYWQDVAPIMYERCGACHQEGGIGPFSLVDYDSASQWARAAASAVEARLMPPWLVTSDGSCGDFADSPQLSDDEIAAIVAWADADAPEGTVRDDLQVPATPALDSATSFSTPNFVPEIAGGGLAEFDEYRCFLIDPELEQDTFLTGYNVVPGND